MDLNIELRNRRKELGLTMLEVAKKVGVSEGTISRWESGDIANMRRDKIVALAKALKTTPSFIMDCDGETFSSVQNDNIPLNQEVGTPYNPVVHEIPILGRIAAGLPIYAEQNIEDYTYTDRNGGAEYFALRVKGDSMSAAHINDGSIIIVRRQPEVDNGQIAVVRVDKDDATVKRFRQEGNLVHLIAHSFNPEHQVQTYNLKNTKIDVIGKVVECRVEF